MRDNKISGQEMNNLHSIFKEVCERNSLSRDPEGGSFDELNSASGTASSWRTQSVELFELEANGIKRQLLRTFSG